MRLAAPLIAAVVLAAAAACASACSGKSNAAADAGCPDDLPSACPTPTPSYAGQVQAILATRCLICHGNGGQAQQSRDLSDYDHIYTSRGVMLDQVYQCEMPLPDAGQLTSAERQALLGWLVCDAPNN